MKGSTPFYVAGVFLLGFAALGMVGVLPFSTAPVPCPQTLTGHAVSNSLTVVTADLITYSQGQSVFGWGPTPAYQPATYQVQGGYTASGFSPTAVFPGYSYGGNQNFPSYFSLNGGFYYQPDGSCSSAPSPSTTTTTSGQTSTSTMTTTSTSTTAPFSGSGGSDVFGWALALAGTLSLVAGAFIDDKEER